MCIFCRRKKTCVIFRIIKFTCLCYRLANMLLRIVNPTCVSFVHFAANITKCRIKKCYAWWKTWHLHAKYTDKWIFSVFLTYCKITKKKTIKRNSLEKEVQRVVRVAAVFWLIDCTISNSYVGHYRLIVFTNCEIMHSSTKFRKSSMSRWLFFDWDKFSFLSLSRTLYTNV